MCSIFPLLPWDDQARTALASLQRRLADLTIRLRLVTVALERARGTADPDRRAALVAEAEKLTVRQLPWIPDVQPTNVLLLSKSLTGAVASLAYLFAPWANQLGGTS